MKRITKIELTNFVMWLCADLGKQICLSDREVKALRKWGTPEWKAPCYVVPYGTKGAWLLDYAGCYGGYQIQEFDSPLGGISCPLGHKRYNARELFAMVCFAREALRLKEQGK